MSLPFIPWHLIKVLQNITDISYTMDHWYTASYTCTASCTLICVCSICVRIYTLFIWLCIYWYVYVCVYSYYVCLLCIHCLYMFFIVYTLIFHHHETKIIPILKKTCVADMMTAISGAIISYYFHGSIMI